MPDSTFIIFYNSSGFSPIASPIPWQSSLAAVLGSRPWQPFAVLLASPLASPLRPSPLRPSPLRPSPLRLSPLRPSSLRPSPL